MNEAKSALSLSIVGFAVGGAALVGELIVLATSKSSKSGVASVAVAPEASTRAAAW